MDSDGGKSVHINFVSKRWFSQRHFNFLVFCCSNPPCGENQAFNVA